MNGAIPDDSLREEIIDKGEVVYSLFWDSGAPGPGAEYETIYRFQDKYYPILSYEEDTIPYETIEAALEASELTLITEATQEIETTEIAAAQLVQMLRYEGDKNISIAINGENWLVSPDGKFQKAD